MNIKEIFRKRRAAVARARRIRSLAGLASLFSGYAFLAVSPDTPADWLMARVVLGFVCLFAGFVLAVVPFLNRSVGDDR
ncbi:MAG: hypothetical protein NTY26_09745 [Burkholderiales bacterium]|nr:hypothetical protein [Burkholderiales bacterium]